MVSEKAAKTIVDKIERVSEQLGLGDRWISSNRMAINEKYGLCSSCKHHRLVKTRYAIKLWKCFDLEMNLNMEDPVTECSYYDKVGSLTLQQMVGMAHLIDIDKGKVGF